MSVFRGIVVRTVRAGLVAGLTIPGLIFVSGTAAAQEVEEPPASLEQNRGQLEEILVTARKKEEKLQDVPISISAFSAKGIRDRNITDAYSLADFTPNFNLTQNLGRRLDVPNIRGQFGPLIGGTAPNASFFIDGVFVSGSIGSTSTANLERIEVLRGPQSAQFGRATFAGAVNYITRKPTNDFEGEVNGRYGEDGDNEYGAWASGPLIEDKLYFYAGANKKSFDGEWRNDLRANEVSAVEQNPFFGPFIWSTNPQRAGDPACPAGSIGGNCAVTKGDNTEIGGQETKIATFKLTWEASDTLQFNIKYERAEADDDHFASLYLAPATENNCFRNYTNSTSALPGGGPAGTPQDADAGSRSGGWKCGEVNNNDYTAKLNLPHFRRGVTTRPPGAPAAGVTSAPAPFLGQQEEIDRFYVDAIWDIGDYELTARYAHNETTSEFVRDLDRSYALGPANTGLFEAYSRDDDEDDSYEIRLASPVDQPLRWQVGYYYYNFTTEGNQRNFNAFQGQELSSDGDAETKNSAIFGGLDIDLTDDLTFAFEGRYAKDDVRRSGPDCNDPVLDPNGEECAKENFYSFSPRATLTWNVKEDDSLTGYLQVAEGNKPGGFNFAYFDGGADPSASDPEDIIIDEEKATTYELGLKGTYLDGELSANLAVFYIDWTNQAINVLECIPEKDPPGTCQENNIVDNAGRSRVKGLELEMQWFPTDYQSYTLAYGYTDSEVREYIDDEYAVLRCPESCYDTLPGSDELTPAAQAERDALGDVAGQNAPRVPEHNLALSQLYQAPWFDTQLEWFVRNDYIYEDKKYSTVSNLTWAPSQWTWNGRVGLESERWTVTLFVDNITDEKSPVQVQDFPLFDFSNNYTRAGAGEILQNAFIISPRRSRNSGITAQYRFGGAN